jgi:hypothetical protein
MFHYHRPVAHPCRFIHWERAPGTCWTGGCVDPRAGVDAVEKGRMFFPSRESNSGRPAYSPSQYRLTKLSHTYRIGGQKLHWTHFWSVNPVWYNKSTECKKQNSRTITNYKSRGCRNPGRHLNRQLDGEARTSQQVTSITLLLLKHDQLRGVLNGEAVT